MEKILRNILFIISLLIFAGTTFTTIPLIISTNKINNDIANQVTSSEYNPLQILPKDLSPTPLETNNYDTDILSNLKGDSINNCKEISVKIKEDAKKIIDSITTSSKDYYSINLGIIEFYNQQATISGKIIKNFNDLAKDSIYKKYLLLTSIQNMKQDIDNFKCDANNQLIQLNLFLNDSNTAINQLKDYNLSNKLMLSFLKTKFKVSSLKN